MEVAKFERDAVDRSCFFESTFGNHLVFSIIS